MNKLVMDMLELSKLEAGKIDLHIIDFSLTELTEEVLVKNSVDINKNNLTVVKIILLLKIYMFKEMTLK